MSALSGRTLRGFMCTELPASRSEELRQRLSELDARFDREMRARGFDPAQAENVALPSGLARLWAQREELRAHLDELLAQEQTENHDTGMS